MGVIIEALCRVQKIQRNLHVIRTKEESILRQISFAQRQVDDLRAKRRSHHGDVQKLQMEIDRIDLEVKTTEESVNKHRMALNAAKSNKEYAAILTALNTEKVDSSKRETRMLELMGKVDDLRQQDKNFEAEEARLLERVEHHNKLLQKFRDDNREAIEHIEKERTEAAGDLPPSALDTFTRIAERHEGEAMAEVARTNPRSHDYRCGGCNMSVPLEQVNRLSSADELQICNCCGRILCLEKHAAGAGA